MKHLAPDTANLLNLPVPERRKAILADKWIAYNKARQVTQKMTYLLSNPPVHRMSNLLVVGDANNGKTTVIRQFMRAYGSSVPGQDGRLIGPVLCIQAPAEPDEQRFYHTILEQANIPYRLADRIDRKRQMVIQALRRSEVRLLVMDEIQYLLAGSERKQRSIFNAIKHLSDDLRISFVWSGLSTICNAIQRDEQLANRFELIDLPRWTMGEEYLAMLAGFERLLPLHNASGLVAAEMGQKLLKLSDGLLGELAIILKLAAIAAVDSKEERITPALLDGLGYLPLSQRRTY